MTAFRDRVLKLSLREIVGGQIPPDLTARILGAVRERSPHRERRGRWHWGWRTAIAAALLLAVLGITWWMLSEDARGVGHASEDLVVWQERDGGERRSRHLAQGDLALIDAGTDVVLPGELRLSCLASTLLRVRGPDRLQPLAGELLVRGRASIEMGLASINTGNRSAVYVSVRSAGRRNGRVLVQRIHRGLAAWTVELAVRVREGEALLVVGSERERLGRGQELIVRRGLPILWRGPLRNREEQRMRVLLAEMSVSVSELNMENEQDRARFKKAWHAGRELCSFLLARPQAWSVLRKRLLPMPKEPSRRNLWLRLLEIFGHAPDPGSENLVLEALSDPQAFLPGEFLVLLAERRVAGARELLAQRIDGPAPFPMLVPVGIYLALQGDDRGTQVLRRFLDDPATVSMRPRLRAPCAVALRTVGEGDAWAALVAEVGEEVERKLRAGEEEQARHLVLELIFSHERLASRESSGSDEAVRVFGLESALPGFIERNLERLPTPRAIRGELAELRRDS